MDTTDYIAIAASMIALCAVVLQRKELKNQILELKKTASANEGAQKALEKQNKLQAYSSLLDAEIHLHNFNDKGGVHASQKSMARANLAEITSLKEQLKKII